MKTPRTLKKLFLSKEEKQNLIFRRMTIAYLQDVAEKDINTYISQVVCPRLGIKADQVEKVGNSFEYVELKEVKTNGKQPVQS